MSETSIADNPWAAAACWAGAPFSGGLVPVALLIITWKNRGSLTRRHALAATLVWAVLLAIYLPAFLFGWFIPAFSGTGPEPWAVTTVVALFVMAWTTAVIGVVVVWVSSRRTTAAPAST